PAVLHFNHQLHLLGGRAGGDGIAGPGGHRVELRCDDCHRAGGTDASLRFAASVIGPPSRAAQPVVPREPYMAPIAFASHCAGCHALTVDDPDHALGAEGSVPAGEVPHTAPSTIRTWLRGRLAASAASGSLEHRLAAFERQLYGREGLGC